MGQHIYVKYLAHSMWWVLALLLSLSLSLFYYNFPSLLCVCLYEGQGMVFGAQAGGTLNFPLSLMLESRSQTLGLPHC